MEINEQNVNIPVGEVVATVTIGKPDIDLTRIPVKRAIFRLAWPATATYLCIMLFNIVDGWWVAKLGADALAGVGAASFIYWTLESVATLISTGVNAMVARFIGAKEPEKAVEVATQGFILSFLVSIIVSIGGFIFQDRTYRLMGLEGGVFDAAHEYMTVILAGLSSIFLIYTLDACFRGMGNTRTPFIIISFALALNAILDPVFIFGIGPVPEMGVTGAAIATILTHAIGTVIAYIKLRKQVVHIDLSRKYKSFFNISIMWRISRIGMPIATSGVIFSLTYMALTRIVSSFGTAPIAAMALGHRLEGLAFFACVGFSVAAATLVGQHLGARQTFEAERSAWLTIQYISLFLALVSLLYFIFAEPVFRFFINDPDVVREGTKYLRIIAIFEIFLGFEVVLEGAFSGAGNSIPPMVTSVPLTILRIPLAILLANHLDLGITGIWWAISTSTAAKGIIMGVWFKAGRWKKHKV